MSGVDTLAEVLRCCAELLLLQGVEFSHWDLLGNFIFLGGDIMMCK